MRVCQFHHLSECSQIKEENLLRSEDVLEFKRTCQQQKRKNPSAHVEEADCFEDLGDDSVDFFNVLGIFV
jgi:hypothetical protein